MLLRLRAAERRGAAIDSRESRFSFALLQSPFGEVGVVRHAGREASPVCRILLPRAGRSMEATVLKLFPEARRQDGEGDETVRRIRELLAGAAVAFAADDLDLAPLGGFRKRVLIACAAIPRGFVTGYGDLAAAAGAPGAARAAGNVMAKNPFPLLIPCHRVVRAGGALGGFGGGLALKRGLLALEGVVIDPRGRVAPRHLLRAPLGPAAGGGG